MVVHTTAAALAALAIGLACAPPAVAQTPPPAEQRQASAELAAIIADYETWAAEQDPWTAGAEGDRAALSRLSDPSRQAELARREPLARFRDRLAAIDPAGLSADERLNQTRRRGCRASGCWPASMMPPWPTPGAASRPAWSSRASSPTAS
mgnify:CR=1 FL=1